MGYINLFKLFFFGELCLLWILWILITWFFFFFCNWADDSWKSSIKFTFGLFLKGMILLWFFCQVFYQIHHWLLNNDGEFRTLQKIEAEFQVLFQSGHYKDVRQFFPSCIITWDLHFFQRFHCFLFFFFFNLTLDYPL